MIKKIIFLVSCFAVFPLYLTAHAASNDLQYSLIGEPVRDAFVSGDADKFRAQHWMDNSYVGGVQDATFHDKIGKDITIDMSGHALIDDNDFAGNVTVKKKNLGYVLFDYSEFRKWYDPRGGDYSKFTTLKYSDTNQDLHMDIGHIKVETGLDVENWPKISAAYERDFKEGAKSMLTWTPVTAPVVSGGSRTRYIGPSWMSMNEVTDSFTLKESHTINGFELKGEQRFEQMTNPTQREEASLNTTMGTPSSGNKIRDQYITQRSRSFFSQYGFEKWFHNDQMMVSSAYQLNHLVSTEIANLIETDVNGVITSYTRPEQWRNAIATNRYNAHTWVGNFMYLPKPWLNVITKLKAEAIRSVGDSALPELEDSPYTGTVTEIDRTDTSSKIAKLGQEISIRFTKIPRTAIYSDLGLQEIRNWRSENQTDITGDDVFFWENIDNAVRANWDIGTQVSPIKNVYITSQVRQMKSHNNYNNKNIITSVPDPDGAFYEMFNTSTTEFSSRISWRPSRWVQPAFRYQYRKDTYSSIFPYTGALSDITEQSTTKANVFTFDVSSQLKEWLLATLSVSRRYAYTYTPAGGIRFTPTGQPATTIPGFKDNSDTYMLNLDYLINDKMTFNTAISYSRAANFDDYSATGMPYGAQFQNIDLTAGLKWIINKHITIGPKYVFYHYNVDPNTLEVGNYNAHLIWFDVSIH